MIVIAIVIVVLFSLTLIVMIHGRRWKDDIDRAIDEAFKEAEMKELE